MNHVENEQVEETNLLGVTVDCKLVIKMGRGLSVIKRCFAFLTSQSTRQVLQDLVLSHLDYRPVILSSGVKKDIGKSQLSYNRAAQLALKYAPRANITNTHVNLSCLNSRGEIDRIAACLCERY
jgi:hypothetical protein